MPILHFLNDHEPVRKQQKERWDRVALLNGKENEPSTLIR